MRLPRKKLLRVTAGGYWSFNATSTFDNLIVGESVSEVFNVTTVDGTPSTVTITINGTDDLPVARADYITLTEDGTPSSIAGNALSNDSFVDGLGSINWAGATPDSAGTLFVTGRYGTLAVGAGGYYKYYLNNANAAVQGITTGEKLYETFNYTLTDRDGDSSKSFLSVTINGTDDLVVARPEYISLTEDSATSSAAGNAVSNDSFVDGFGSIKWSGDISADSGGSVFVRGNYGVLYIGDTGYYNYYLNNSLASVQRITTGEKLYETFNYTLTDSDGDASQSFLSVTINGADDLAVARPDYISVAEDRIAATSGYVSTNDSFVDGFGSLNWAGASAGSDGQLYVTGRFGTLAVNADGYFDYYLNNANAAVQGITTGEELYETFNYTLTDRDGDSSKSFLSVTINGTDDLVVARPEYISLTEDSATSSAAGNAVSNDSFVDGFGSIKWSGDISADSGGSVFVRGNYGALYIGDTGYYNYYLNNSLASVQRITTGENLYETFNYTLTDRDGDSDNSYLSITIRGTDDLVTARPDYRVVTEDGNPLISGNVTNNDSFGDGLGSLTWSWATTGTDGILYVAGRYGTLAVNANGYYDYYLNNANTAVQGITTGERLYETFHYNLTDRDGDSNDSFLSVTINGADDLAVARPDYISVAEGHTAATSGFVNLNDSFVDGFGSLNWAGAVPGSNGLKWVTGKYGTLAVNINGYFDYYLNNANTAVQGITTGEKLYETFNYTLTDRDGDASQTFLSVTINGSATGPVTPLNDYNYGAHTAVLTSGRYVTVYTNRDGDDGSRWGAFVQLFDSSGKTIGNEIQINAYTTNDQWRVAVAATKNGGFIATWSNGLHGTNSVTEDVIGQLFDGNARYIGGNFLVNNDTGGAQRDSSVATLSNTDIVIVWESNSGNDSDPHGFGVTGQRYNQWGGEVGGEFRVNRTTSGAQRDPEITALTDGGFAVSWTSSDRAGTDGIYLQFFHANGSKEGSEILVNSYTASDQTNSAITSLARGGAVVTWQSEGQDGSVAGVYAQIYNNYGGRVGGELRVNTYANNVQDAPDIAATPDGGFIIVWQSWDQDGDQFGVYAQRYNLWGNRLGGEFLVTEITAGSARYPSVAVQNDGTVIVSYELGESTTALTGTTNIYQVVIPADELAARSATPIVFDLNRSNEIEVTGETTAQDKSAIEEIGATVQFDIDGDGRLDTIEWISGSGDALLIDNRDGLAYGELNGNRLFGDRGGIYEHGYQPLAELDTDGDGQLTGDELNGLELWVDDGDAVFEDGEALQLAEAGIAAISTELKLTPDSDGRTLIQSEATLEDGTKLLTEDVWFKVQADDLLSGTEEEPEQGEVNRIEVIAGSYSDGDDILIADEGIDLFVWSDSDQALQDAAFDRIQNFNVLEDVLDISDMLDFEDGEVDDISSYLSLTEDDTGNAVLKVAANGEETDQQIVFDNVGLDSLRSDLGLDGGDNTQLLNRLVEEDKLII